MSLCVLTAWYERPELAAILRESCQINHLMLRVCGQGNWPHDMRTGKLEATLRAIPKLRKEGFDLVLYADGFDSFIVGDEVEIRYRWNAMGKRPMVLSGEKNCWPDAHKADRYPNSDSLWRFINAGTWIAQINYLEDVLSAMLKRVPESERDDQRMWTDAYLDGWLPGAVVDTERVLFQTMWQTSIYEVGSSPVIHHNGGVWRDGPGNKFETHWEIAKKQLVRA